LYLGLDLGRAFEANEDLPDFADLPESKIFNTVLVLVIIIEWYDEVQDK